MEYGEQCNWYSRLYKTSDLKCLIKRVILVTKYCVWSIFVAMENKFGQNILFKEMKKFGLV